MVAASQSAATSDTPSAAASGRERLRRRHGASAKTAPAAEIASNTRSVCWVPMEGTSTRLTSNAPAIAPSVLAAYTPPTTRPESSPASATAAQARGKLAPQSSVGGRIAHRQRAMSN